MAGLVIAVLVLAAAVFVLHRKLDARVRTIEAKIIKNPPQKSASVVASEAVADHERKYHRN